MDQKHQTYTGFFLLQDMTSFPCPKCKRKDLQAGCMCSNMRAAFNTAWNSTCAALRAMLLDSREKSNITAENSNDSSSKI